MRISRLEWKRTMNQKKIKINGGDHNGPFLFIFKALYMYRKLKMKTNDYKRRIKETRNFND